MGLVPCGLTAGKQWSGLKQGFPPVILSLKLFENMLLNDGENIDYTTATELSGYFFAYPHLLKKLVTALF